MTTVSGQATNAVHGFTSMLIHLWNEHKPSEIAVAFDLPEPTFRHKAIPTYKANRPPPPDVLVQQMDLVRGVLKVLGIPSLEVSGYEADDVIATLATRYRDAGKEVIIVTGDRDAYQLVEDPYIKVLYSTQRASGRVMYDEAVVFEKTGVAPSNYVLYAALRGDTSDNLPGVPGIGPKTAAQLIQDNVAMQNVTVQNEAVVAADGLDEILAVADTLSPRLRANLLANEERVRSNISMMQLVRGLDINKNSCDLSVSVPDVDALRELFQSLEFRSLYARLVELPSELLGGVELPRELVSEQVTEILTPDFSECTDVTQAVEMLNRLLNDLNGEVLAFSVHDGSNEDEGNRAGVCFLTDSKTRHVSFVSKHLLQDDNVKHALKRLIGHDQTTEDNLAQPSCVQPDSFEQSSIEQSDNLACPDSFKTHKRPLAVHGMKSAMQDIFKWADIEVRLPHLDTKLAAYLMDPSESGSSKTRYELEGLAQRYADVGSNALGFLRPPSTADGQLSFDSGETQHNLHIGWQPIAVARLVRPMRKKLETENLTYLYDRVEIPLLRVLTRMERAGIQVDKEVLTGIRDKITAEAEAVSKTIYSLAGHDFNLNSPKQLGDVLFKDMGLKPLKKTRRGFSTDAQTLESLKSEHEVIPHIIDYRELAKLKSAYGDSLLSCIDTDMRIRATFHQTVTRTGRLSSDVPNLHNIPVRGAWGMKFRSVFVAPEGHRLLIADYDQIELRCIAHLSEDPNLVAAFKRGDDIHSATAAHVFNIDMADVGVQERTKAKMVSYGLMYGMSAYGLGMRLGVSKAEAKEVLKAYFSAFPLVSQYMKTTVEKARELGYTKTETPFRRKCPIPELHSPQPRVRQAGERQAMNAGVQGLAADIFKIALVNLDDALEKKCLKSRIVLQVHDEIIVESPVAEVETAAELVSMSMSEAWSLLVPLKVDLKTVHTWAEAKRS